MSGKSVENENRILISRKNDKTRIPPSRDRLKIITRIAHSEMTEKHHEWGSRCERDDAIFLSFLREG